MYITQSIDTTQEIELIQFQLWRKMPLEKKAEIFSNWSKGCWEMCLLAIQNRYPQCTNKFLREQFLLITLKQDIKDYVNSAYCEQKIMINDPISLTLVMVDILEHLEIPYLVGGSVASSLLGEPRSTQDIDLVADIKITQIDAFIEAIQPRFYVSESAVKTAIEYQQSFNIIDNESLVKFDIFILKNEPFYLMEFQRRKQIIVKSNPEQKIFLPTAEDLILQKILWYKMGFNSEKQWRDILGVIKLQLDNLDQTYLDHWAEILKISDSLKMALQQSGFNI